MYNNVYQEYINYMIGGTSKRGLDFQDNMINLYSNFQNTTNIKLEQFYPELYKLIYPMIQTACMRNTKPITEETINEMIQDVYSNFNADDVSFSETRDSNRHEKVSKPNNYVLNDLIRILLIRELLGRSENLNRFNNNLFV